MPDDQIPEWVEKEAQGFIDFLCNKSPRGWVDVARVDGRVLDRVWEIWRESGDPRELQMVGDDDSSAIQVVDDPPISMTSSPSARTCRISGLGTSTSESSKSCVKPATLGALNGAPTAS